MTRSSIMLAGPADAYAWTGTATWNDARVGLAELRVTLAVDGEEPVFDATGGSPLVAAIDTGLLVPGVAYVLREHPTRPGPAEGLSLTLWLNRTG